MIASKVQSIPGILLDLFLFLPKVKAKRDVIKTRVEVHSGIILCDSNLVCSLSNKLNKSERANFM